jgi:ATP-binding cassette subfamily F protein 3
LVLSADRPDGGGAGKNAPKALAKSEVGGGKKGPSLSTLRFRLADAEKAVTKEQHALDTIDARLASPSLYTEGAKALADLTKKREWHAQALAKAEAAWIELSEAIEAAS